MNTRLNFKGVPFLLLCTVAAFSVGAGCNCDPDLGPNDAGDDAGVEDSGVDAGPEDGGFEEDAGVDAGVDGGIIDLPDGGGQCVTNNGACTIGSGLSCCSGNCTGTVCAPATFCANAPTACESNVDCCSGNCVLGACSEVQCVQSGNACTEDVDCCSGDCAGNICVAGSCSALNDACGLGCCSTNCQNGQCAKATSCVTAGDVCFRNDDCCSTLCSSNDGVTGGRCVAPTGAPNCGQNGQPCVGATDCCTKVCADPGSGVKVCQAVAGCRVAGDTCNVDDDCCGGLGTPGGTVDCHNTNKKCDNGGSCRMPGTICGKPMELDGTCVKNPDGTCFTVPNETNCCFGNKINGNEMTCRTDEVGVPRCFGGGNIGSCPAGYTGEDGCCIAVGEVCQFSDQCCSGAPCVPDESGVPRCTVPQCLGLGTDCDPAGTGAAACCAGSVCNPTSEITYACQLPGTVPDGGGCQANAQVCTSSGQCCSGICEGGVCKAPDVCQPQDATCTVNGDCCSGLSCTIPPGQTSGTCKTGTTCPGAGQNCSPTSLCCGEGVSLQCLNTSGFNCDGTTSCACEFILTKPGTSQPE